LIHRVLNRGAAGFWRQKPPGNIKPDAAEDSCPRTERNDTGGLPFPERRGKSRTSGQGTLEKVVASAEVQEALITLRVDVHPDDPSTRMSKVLFSFRYSADGGSSACGIGIKFCLTSSFSFINISKR